MKKQFAFLIAVAILAGSSAFAQTLITQVKPAGSKTWGYANDKGEIIIPAQYEKCYRFSESGYATVYDTKAHQHIFINTKGEKLATEITSFKLKDGMGADLDGFRDGLVGIRVGEKWGFMNVLGKIAIPAKYDDVSEFSGGYAIAKLGSSYIVLNTKGEEIIVQDGTIVEVKDFSEGLAPFRTSDKKFGFIGTDGRVAVPAQFESVGYFSNGLAWAKIVTGTLGYINTKGEWAVQPQFEAGKTFDPVSGLARVKTTTGSWVYVNKTGELTYVNDTEVWGDFSEGLSDGKKNDKKGFYDSKGKWVILPQYDGVRDFKNGFAAAKIGDKWGMIDKTGKWVIQPTFDGIKDMELVSGK